MGKLRHIAITAADPDAAAAFYESAFDMTRVWTRDIGVMLTDGLVSLAILNFPTDEMAGDERGKAFRGLHHIGFVVDDLGEADKKVVDAGGHHHMRMPGELSSDTEQKFRDPNGVVFDIVNDSYANNSWGAKR
ncbi:MAG: VOC family protein [Gammaproteobacteria bacterium]|nr:VOC family protein [Gammaproteobacteria bacterium]